MTETDAMYVSVVLKEEQLAGCVEDRRREKVLEKKKSYLSQRNNFLNYVLRAKDIFCLITVLVYE